MLHGSFSNKTKTPKKTPTKTPQLLSLENNDFCGGERQKTVISMMPMGFVPWLPHSCSGLGASFLRKTSFPMIYHFQKFPFTQSFFKVLFRYVIMILLP